jgi:hypothetical protein
MTLQLMKTLLLPTCFTAISITCLAQTHPAKELTFHSDQGLAVKVHKGVIAVNNKDLYKLRFDDIIYSSKRNRLIRNGGSTFLFLEIDGRPNRDMLYAFKISANKVDSVANAISSDIWDMDGDGYSEFGGTDLNEAHPSEDSMYYLPSCYFEISNGRIAYDSAYSEEIDFRINGVYLSHPADVSGSCCTTIVKPGKRKVTNFPLTHPLILSERTDGPANVRDAINGKLLFRLYSNVPVYTSDTVHKWQRIALNVYISKEISQSHVLPAGSKLYNEYMDVGETLADIPFDEMDVHEEHGYTTLTLTGYTSTQNILPETVPENILPRLIAQGASTIAGLTDFLKGFQFSKDKIDRFNTWQMDESHVSGPSAPIRLLLVFNDDKLLGVVHSRRLRKEGEEFKQYRLKRGYTLSVTGNAEIAGVNDFIAAFNKFIDAAD